jgi:SAM-dependent methyltransferase
MNKASELYTGENSEYSKKIPTWHVEHADYKSNLVLRMIKKNDLLSKMHSPSYVSEVGCGGGGTLDKLYMTLPETTIFSGYDIAVDAINLAKQYEKDRLQFYCKDIFETDTQFDLLLAMDVFEHVPDYYSFLENCRKKATYKFFIIPMDINMMNILTNRLSKLYDKAGHIHFFNEDSALLTLRNCGYEIIDYTYHIAGFDFFKYGSTSLMTKLMALPRTIFFKFSPSLTLRYLGGGSLVVLAK